jgi:hypothetical protein
MRNIAPIKLKTAQSPTGDRIAQFMWYGWMDVHDQLGYRKDYDSWSESDQGNYERGRCAAAAVKSEWGQVPEWNPKQPIMRSLRIATESDIETCRIMSDEFRYQNALPVAQTDVASESHERREPIRQRRDVRVAARTIKRHEFLTVRSMV